MGDVVGQRKNHQRQEEQDGQADPAFSHQAPDTHESKRGCQYSMESENYGTVFVTRSRPEAKESHRAESQERARMGANVCLGKRRLVAHIGHLAFGDVLVIFPSVEYRELRFIQEAGGSGAVAHP